MISLSRRMMMTASASALLTATGHVAAQPAAAPAPTGHSAVTGPVADTEWRTYGGDQANTRYSPLAQINASNFNKLEIAWRFPTAMLGLRPEYQYECTPLLIKGRLFITAGTRRDVACLDALTGELLWMHRENEGARATNAPRQLSGHGVSYWSDGDRERILYVTIGYRLISLDAKTGIPDPTFGDGGVVDLKLNDDQQIDLLTGDVGLHATPAVSGDIVIVGAAHTTGDIPKTRYNVKGYVRAFDVRTGKRLWIFHTIPMKGEFGYDTWITPGQAERTGNTGVWAQMSIDEELGLAYLGVELPTGDYLGTYRHGPGLFGETLVAVDIKTGQRRWHYQMVHHGIWDRDVPCAAILCDIPHNGKIVKALAQPTKQAFLYVLNRETGEPIWPIPERKVPAGDVPDEWYSPTQPVPTKPPAYDRQGVTPDDLVDFTPAIKAKALEIASHYRYGPLFSPTIISKPEGPWGTLWLPGVQGGTNWGGGCYDPQTHKVFVFSKTQLGVGGIIENANKQLSDFDFIHAVTGEQREARTIMGAANFRPPGELTGGGRYSLDTPIRPGLTTVAGLPLIKPPYGRISAIDLANGTIAWQVAHGETPDYIRNHPLLKGIAIPRTGQPGNSGPMVTAALVICGDMGVYTDETGRVGARLRGYDKATGEEKGAVYLPGSQTGVPMTYALGGRQYIVVAVGGAHPAELIAFRLPAGTA